MTNIIEQLDSRPQVCKEAECPHFWLQDEARVCPVIECGAREEDLERMVAEGILLEECEGITNELEADLVDNGD